MGRGINPSDAANTAHNAVYDLADAGSVQGIVLLSSGLAALHGPEVLLPLCERFRGLPMCSFGLDLPGVPSVVADNRIGMQAVVEHLIRDHGCRRLAFIGGPPNNPDAEICHAVYRSMLADHDVAFDPRLVAQGQFTVQSGASAAIAILDCGQLPDAR